MTVHIDELHTDVVPAAPGRTDEEERRATEPEWAHRDRATGTACRREWLEHRVRAVGFDD